MSNKVVTMNSTSFYPTDIKTEEIKIAEYRRMADGTAKMYYRTSKKKWQHSWENLPESRLTAIRTIFALTTTFAYVDEYGTSFTVLCPPDGLDYDFSASNISLGGTIYYNVNLTLEQV